MMNFVVFAAESGDPAIPVQLILFLLIVFGSSIWTGLKKVNEWINKNRMPKPAPKEPAPQERSFNQPRPEEREVPTQKPRKETPSAFEIFQELEQALTGKAEKKAEEAPKPKAAPPPEPRPKGRLAQQLAKRAQDPAMAFSYSSRKKNRLHGLNRRKESRAAQLFQNPKDLRRGILMQEILSLPRAHRPFQRNPRS